MLTATDTKTHMRWSTCALAPVLTRASVMSLGARTAWVSTHGTRSMEYGVLGGNLDARVIIIRHGDLKHSLLVALRIETRSIDIFRMQNVQ